MCFALALFLVLSPKNAHADFSDEGALESVIAGEVSELAPISQGAWTVDTTVSSYITLYSPQGTVTGYIASLSTNGAESGFIQISVEAPEPSVISFAFEGSDYLTCLLYNADISLSDTDKVVYCGGFDYFVMYPDGRLLSLNSGDYVDNVAAVNIAYEAYSALVEESQEYGLRPYSNESTDQVFLYNYGAANIYLRNLEFYSRINSNISNHCAPTAAANIIYYLKYARGRTSLPSANNDSSRYAVFADLYTKMGTNTQGGGTTLYNVLSGLRSYLAGKDSELSCGTTSPHFTDITKKIDEGSPVQLTISGWSGTQNHDVNLWGYYVGSYKSYYYITSNQDAGGDPSFMYIDCTIYSVEQAVYVKVP